MPPTLPTPATLHDDLRRLQWLRDFAIAGVALLALLARPVFYTVVPLPPVFMLLGVWVVISIVTWIRLRRPAAVTPKELLLQIGLDLFMLTLLLALSGGPANPLTALYLPSVALAAAVLSTRQALLIALLSIVAYSMLWQFSLPLTVEDVDRAMQMHLTGMWLTFAASATLIAGFVSRITAALREREQQLAAAREQALRDERIFALGNLAAGAAHELGTPLATMAVIAGELHHDPALPEPLREDVQLLNAQILACKGIISGLAERAGLTRAEGGRAIALDAWLQQLVARWQSLRPLVHPQLVIESGNMPTSTPQIFAETTLEQALLNLFNNAADVSPEDVAIHLRWDAQQLEIDILDRGPGLDAAQRQQAGREVFDSPQGAGIGLLLAHAAFHRYGGNIRMEPRAGKGLCVRAQLPLRDLIADNLPTCTQST